MKLFQMLRSKLHYFTHFPFEDTYRDQIEKDAIAGNYRSERMIAYLMLVLQIIMLVVFTLYPGNIFLSVRRRFYWITYLAMIVGLLVLLPLHKHYKDNWQMHNKVCTAFGILLSLWVIIISYLDALGSMSIIIYCSVLPIMAIFLAAPPYVLSILFMATCIATNCLVLSTPYGQENMFNTLVNSVFICVLSVLYAYRIYHTRVSDIYDKMIIEEKNRQLEAVNRELDLLSMTDPLTGLGNRRYLEENIRLSLQKYGVHVGSLTVLLADIDFFKQYNDRYGHLQGDQCLKEVARVLSSFAEDHNFKAVRYGGEEFILVMNGLSLGASIETAEQIRKSVADVQIPDAEGKNTSFTISVGISFHSSWQSDLCEKALDEADKALYEAKQSGRNRTVLFHELVDNQDKL